MKKETLNRVHDLKEANQDFEWFETTPEILQVLNDDIIHSYSNEHGYYRETKFIHASNNHNENFSQLYNLNIPKFLDIGCGRGNIFDSLAGNNTYRINIESKFGIEKADLQADDLIRRNIAVIGRDFFKTVLLGKMFNIVFSNPPYSIFEDWTEKILKEVTAQSIYLLLPTRWQNNEYLVKLMHERGELTIIGEYDFTKADRSARAKVNLIKITINCHKNQDGLFDKWIEQNIGNFESQKINIPDTKKENDIDIKYQQTTADVLSEQYKDDMKTLMETYQKLNSIDFSLLQQLGITKDGVLTKIKDDINSLKNKYWHKAFDVLKPINTRLTNKTRKKMLTDIQWFSDLDFTSDNIKTIIVWVIENYNKFVKEQVLQSFDDMTNFEQVHTYKSNKVWTTGGWRYNGRDIPEKYSLDYRVITRCYISNYQYDRQENIISDLCVVASNLGFSNDGVDVFKKDGKKYYCYDKGGNVVFEYKLFQNNNAHVKFNKDFIQAFNLEVGRLKNWLQCPEDAANEFDMPIEEAQHWWVNGNLQLMNKNNKLLLSFNA